MGDRASSYAAAIAYYTLFSVLPLSIFVIGFGSYFVTNSDRDRMVANIADALGGASTVKIYEQVQSFTEGRAELGIIGLIGALWGASAVFTAVRTGLNVVWNTSDGRPWLIAKAVDLLSVIGFGLLLALALAGVAGLVALSELTKEMLGSRVAGLTSFGLGVFFLVLPFLIAFATFSQLYVVTSPASVHWTDCWHGAAVAAAGFQATSYGFGWYVRSFGRFDKLYGSLGAVIAFVFYAYVVASLVLLGAEIARQYVEWKRRRPSCVPVL
jgi:membrane protein